MNKGLFEKRCKYSIRKFSLGVASVMIGAAFFGTSPVLADSVQSGSTANLPADLATALATAKRMMGVILKRLRWEKTKVLQKLQMDLRQKKNY